MIPSRLNFTKLIKTYILGKATYISLDELGEVRIPDVEHLGPLEQVNASLIGLKIKSDFLVQ